MGDVSIVAYILFGSVLDNSIVGRTVRYRTKPIQYNIKDLLMCETICI